MARKTTSDRLTAFFFKIAQRSFADLKLGDEETVTYVANLLSRFARAEKLYPFRGSEGKHEASIVKLLSLEQADLVDQEALVDAREMRKYVGDYTLFMTGIFRAHVEKWGYLDYYLREGQRSYRRVSELDLCLYRAGFMLFKDLAENFEYYSGALDYMRKAYFAPQLGENPFADFLKKVEGWVASGLSQN